MKPDPRLTSEVDSRTGLPRWLMPGIALAAIVATAGAAHELTASLLVVLLAIATFGSLIRLAIRVRHGGWKHRFMITAGWLVATVVTAWLVG